jgi:outer membrane scaffolding protein for murein synthesis (MipA/OmpV family)
MLAVTSALAFAVPAAAQSVDAPPAAEGDSVFDGDYLTLGAGAIYVPSYEGSDDYTISALPLLQGSIGGIGISPRAAGVALDFIPDGDSGPQFSLGPSVRVRLNRASDVKDPVVELLPELDTAIEVGPSAGVSFPGVLNPYDSLAFTVDARWDVAGAHDGMTINPSVSYTTPLSTGIAAVLSVSGEWADDNFMDYYYSVDTAAATITGLDEFQAQGGLKSLGTQLLLGWDLNNNLMDGGLALFFVGGYSKLMNDAKASPFTSERGSASQWMGGAGLAFTF